MSYLATRITQLHPEWKVNIITQWSDLQRFLDKSGGGEDAAEVRALLENEHVGAAHKSDFIRFYLLKEYGGFWLDISTFLLCPLDVYFKQADSYIHRDVHSTIHDRGDHLGAVVRHSGQREVQLVAGQVQGEAG